MEVDLESANDTLTENIPLASEFVIAADELILVEKTEKHGMDKAWPGFRGTTRS